MANQTMFRMLKPPKSSYFCGRKFNARGIAGAFKARKYLQESDRIMASAINPEEWGLVKSFARNAFFEAHSRYLEQCDPSAAPLSKDEMAFFIKFYPFSMIRDGVLSQVEAELAKQMPMLIDNKIRMTKHNLTALFTVLSGEKPLSIVTSPSEIDVFSDASSISFGRLGSALFHPLDKSSWLVARSEETLNSVHPDAFYYDMRKAGRALGYPEGAIEWFASSSGDRYTMIELLLHFDKQMEPWLFKSVFVPYVTGISGQILNMDILIKWHETLGNAVGPDILELLSLEAKIETIMKIAETVEKRGIELSKLPRTDI
jgi:hypothetical protein